MKVKECGTTGALATLIPKPLPQISSPKLCSALLPKPSLGPLHDDHLWPHSSPKSSPDLLFIIVHHWVISPGRASPSTSCQEEVGSLFVGTWQERSECTWS